MDSRARVTDKRGRLNLLLTILAVLVVVIASSAQGAGSDLPTREITLPTGEIAYWLAHDSPTTQIVGDGVSRDKRRIIRWGSGGLYAATRRTYAVFGFRLVTGNPGRMYNWHTQPNDVGGWTPPCAGGGVSPLAIDYWGDSGGLHVTAEPEASGCSGGSGNYHFQILTQAEMEARRGQWVWVWAEIAWGRRELATKGALKIWVAREDAPRVDVSGINTHWSQEEMVTFWEGEYHSSGSPGTNGVEIAATRFGRTPQEAYEDVPVLYRAEPAGSTGGSSAAIDPLLSTEAAIPGPLQWITTTAPPPPPSPKLNVKKVVVGDSTSPSAFSFAVSNGGGTHAFEADGQNELTLPAGTYSVTEPAVSGWTTTYGGCSNVVLATPQSTVPTCTITNTKQQAAPPPPPPPSPAADTTPPSEPGGLTVTSPTPTRLSLAWSASTDNIGVKGYGVYRNGELVVSQDGLTTMLSNLECGTSYTVAVDAHDAAGNRSRKTTTSDTTSPCAPTAPAKPEDPAKPTNPDHPAKPDHPTKPAKPDSPTEPASPTKPDMTTNPDNLDSLAEPDDLTNPAKPDSPTRADKADNPSRAAGSAPSRTAVPTDSGQKAAGRSVLLDDRRFSPLALRSYRKATSASLLGLHPVIVDIFGLPGAEWAADLLDPRPALAGAFRPLVMERGRFVQRMETLQVYGGKRDTGWKSFLGLQPTVVTAYDLVSVRWDGRRFFSRGALKLHLDWSGASYETWVQQHPKAFHRLPA